MFSAKIDSLGRGGSLFIWLQYPKGTKRGDIVAKRNIELMQAIGKRISARRIELKMTQEQAADFTGLSRPFYACIERGEKGVGADSLLKICTAFQISADYLLTGAMQPTERQYMNKLVSQLNEEQRKAALTIMENLLQACGYDLPEK